MLFTNEYAQMNSDDKNDYYIKNKRSNMHKYQINFIKKNHAQNINNGYNKYRVVLNSLFLLYQTDSVHNTFYFGIVNAKNLVVIADVQFLF